jgi:hypothetical protein
MKDINIVYNEICQRENSQIPTWHQPNYLVDTSLTEHSKTEMGIGLAVVYLDETKMFKLNNKSSIYTAEYLALLKGAQLALAINHTKVDICSDSLSALTNLKSKILTEPLALAISTFFPNQTKKLDSYGPQVIVT